MKVFNLNEWGINFKFLIFLAMMFVFRSAIADWSDVPTGSMKPTIVEGDRIVVNKMAYDLRIPFTHRSLIALSDPAAGDIVVFDSSASGKRLVKRVLGIPGDIVQLKNNVLYINHEPLDYAFVSEKNGFLTRLETIADRTHAVQIRPGGTRLSNMSAVKVPDGHYFAMGDNRDNSADSRVIGFVPRHEIVGRSTYVALSLDYSNYFIPRSERFLKRL